MEHDRLAAGVGQDVEQFTLEVPVVDVDRDRPDLERGEVGLQVLDRVVHHQCDGRARREPDVGEVGGDPAGPIVEVAPGADPIALDDGVRIGRLARQRFPDVGARERRR